MSENVITIKNRQSKDCGNPPDLKPSIDQMVGYFENEYGEQSVFIFDKSKKEGLFYSGDAGWDTPFPMTIVNGKVVALDLVLTPKEKEWFVLCFSCLKN